MTNSYQKPSPQTQEEALKIAKSIQRPAQTKEQTKLIAQGIQKGIDLYKRQQKEKAREINKRRKKFPVKQNNPMSWMNRTQKKLSFINSIGCHGYY